MYVIFYFSILYSAKLIYKKYKSISSSLPSHFLKNVTACTTYNHFQKKYRADFSHSKNNHNGCDELTDANAEL